MSHMYKNESFRKVIEKQTSCSYVLFSLFKAKRWILCFEIFDHLWPAADIMSSEDIRKQGMFLCKSCVHGRMSSLVSLALFWSKKFCDLESPRAAPA